MYNYSSLEYVHTFSEPSRHIRRYNEPQWDTHISVHSRCSAFFSVFFLCFPELNDFLVISSIFRPVQITLPPARRKWGETNHPSKKSTAALLELRGTPKPKTQTRLKRAICFAECCLFKAVFPVTVRNKKKFDPWPSPFTRYKTTEGAGCWVPNHGESPNTPRRLQQDEIG